MRLKKFPYNVFGEKKKKKKYNNNLVISFLVFSQCTEICRLAPICIIFSRKWKTDNQIPSRPIYIQLAIIYAKSRRQKNP